MDTLPTRVRGTRPRTMAAMRRPLLALLVLVFVVAALACWRTWSGSSELEVPLQECIEALRGAKEEKENLTETNKVLIQDLESHKALIRGLYDKKAAQELILEDLKDKLRESQNAVRLVQSNLNTVVADQKKTQDDLQKAQEELKKQAAAPPKCDQSACRDLLRAELKEPPKAEPPKQPANEPPKEAPKEPAKEPPKEPAKEPPKEPPKQEKKQ